MTRMIESSKGSFRESSSTPCRIVRGNLPATAAAAAVTEEATLGLFATGIHKSETPSLELVALRIAGLQGEESAAFHRATVHAPRAVKDFACVGGKGSHLRQRRHLS